MEENPQYVYTEDIYNIPDRTTIVLTVAWSALSEEERVQLTKITDALRDKIHPSLTLDAFRVVHVDQLDLSTWTEKPERIVYFGPAIKGLSFYEVIEAGGTKMVLAERLQDLIPNADSRGKLWQALRQLFAAPK